MQLELDGGRLESRDASGRERPSLSFHCTEKPEITVWHVCQTAGLKFKSLKETSVKVQLLWQGRQSLPLCHACACWVIRQRHHKKKKKKKREQITFSVRTIDEKMLKQRCREMDDTMMKDRMGRKGKRESRLSRDRKTKRYVSANKMKLQNKFPSYPTKEKTNIS